MSGDYSRVRFDPLADYSGVQMQQGRVQLDSDWNEWAAILDRRRRAESVDTFGIHPKPGISGVAVVSPQTPDAFKIEVAAVGNGLSGEYFDNKDFSDRKLIRADATIDFDWGTGSPDGSIGTDTFSVRWTGWVEAPSDGDYVFHTYSDDGVRLWVDNKLLIDDWTDHAAKEDSSESITLQAGRKYDIRLEYYENTGLATIKLSWTPPGQSKQVIPQEHLYPYFAIGRGRMYVDGLLAENHGFGATEFEAVLAELHGKESLPYDRQPYLPIMPALAAGNNHLAYLEVWQRELTHHQCPELVENAVGVDTTTRNQTVWQVRMLGDVGDANCSTPEDQFPDWKALIAPSGGRMSIRTKKPQSEPDPCTLPPGGGYRGLENQLYRIEIHDNGAQNAATFKWSRDNASVVGDVVEVVSNSASGTELKLASLGRDDVLRFKTGDWVEILDDWRELGGIDGDPKQRRGEIRKITVDDTTQTITFNPGLPDDLIPSGTGDDTLTQRHTRVKRWDQKGTVRIVDDSDAKVGDYNIDDHGGLIELPAAGTWIELERGIQVAFDLDAAGGDFHCGDYWVSAARTADASVEEFAAAPPRGIHRHYARLSIVTLPDGATDCRTIWPPSDSGCCTYTVGDGVRSHGDFDSIQQAIDALPETGGCICVFPGEYRENLTISRNGITIRGCGADSTIVADAAAPVIHIDGVSNIEIGELQIDAHAEGEGILVDGASGGTPENIALHHLDIHARVQSAIAVFAGQHIDIRDNNILSWEPATASTVFVTADDVGIAHNTVSAANSEKVLPNVDTSGYGAIQIGCTSERVWITDNLISSGGGNGITLGSIQEIALESTNYQLPGALYDIHIERNRILDMGMNGIGVARFFDLSAQDEFISVIGLDIVGNTIHGCLQRVLAQPPANMILDMSYGGICLADVEMLHLHDNCIEENGSNQPQGVCGVFVLHGEGLDISRNRILNNGAEDNGDPKAASKNAKGLRGGIVVKYAIPGITALQIQGTGYPRQNGVPAIRIHDNVVSQPLGQALLMGALGPVSVQGNAFTTRGIATGLAPNWFISAVVIVNLGISDEFYGQIIAFAGAHTDSANQQSVNLTTGAVTIPKKGLDDYGLGQYLANGNVIFSDNQVVTDLMQPEISVAISSVLIASLDDVSFADNQLDASFLIDVMLANAIVLGMSVRIEDNRFKETLFLALFSVMGLGFIFNHTVDNQATHCVYARGLLNPAIERDNLVLMKAFCKQLGVLKTVLDKRITSTITFNG